MTNFGFDSVFRFVSVLSCTCFRSSPIGEQGAGAKLVVSGAVVSGCAAGSTVGGIEIIRGYTIGKGIQWAFSRVFLPPSAIVNARIGDRVLDRNEMSEEFSEAAIVSLLWLILPLTGSLVLVDVTGSSFGYADALFEVASAQGNVGLSTGLAGPSISPVGEGMIPNVGIGRLEIVPVFVFLRSALFGLEP